MINIRLIAEYITEDPLVFNEDIAPAMSASSSLVDPTLSTSTSAPISNTDAESGAHDVSDVDPKQALNQQKAEQERLAKQQHQEQQKLLKPQMKKLDKATQQLQTGLTQSRQTAMQLQQQDDDLSTSVDDLKQALTATTGLSAGMASFNR